MICSVIVGSCIWESRHLWAHKFGQRCVAHSLRFQSASAAVWLTHQGGQGGSIHNYEVTQLLQLCEIRVLQLVCLPRSDGLWYRPRCGLGSIRTQGLGRLLAGQMRLQRVKTGLGFQCFGLCLSDCLQCVFPFVCGSLLRVFLSDTFWGQLLLWLIPHIYVWGLIFLSACCVLRCIASGLIAMYNTFVSTSSIFSCPKK